MKCLICDNEVIIGRGRNKEYCSDECRKIAKEKKSYQKCKERAEMLGLTILQIKIYGYNFLIANPEVVETLKVMNSIDTSRTDDEKKERISKYNKEYRQKNKDKVATLAKEWQEKNKAKVSAYNKKYHQKKQEELNKIKSI